MGFVARTGFASIAGAAVVLGCTIEGEPAPPLFEVVLPLDHDVLLARAGTEHGAAFALSSSLHVFRPGGGHVTTRVDPRVCPWDETADWLPVREQMLVVRDGVIFSRRSCGVWAYRDGTSTATPIVRFVDGGEWNGGGEPKTMIGAVVAAHGDELAACVGITGDPRAQILLMPLDGAPPRQLLGRLEIPFCYEIAVDERAVFAGDPGWIFRVDRTTNEVRRIAEANGNSRVLDLHTTATHLYWSEENATDGTWCVRRVAKDGGPVETIPDTDKVWPYQLEGDGARVFLMSTSAIASVDGLVLKGLVKSVEPFGDAIFGGGELFVRRDRVRNDPPSIARVRVELSPTAEAEK